MQIYFTRIVMIQPPASSLLKKLYFENPRNLKNEAQFTTRFWKQLKERGGFFKKISDMDQSIKPFDAMFAYEWMCGGIEFKKVDGKSCHPYRLLRWSSASKPWYQLQGLSLLSQNWGIALVIVFCIATQTYRVWTVDEMDFTTVWRFDEK